MLLTGNFIFILWFITKDCLAKRRKKRLQKLKERYEEVIPEPKHKAEQLSIIMEE